MKKLFLSFSAALISLTSFAWSQKGHDVVAYIAECHFTPATADSVSSILDGMSPVYWANWLDNASYTPDYAYTKTWHYKNLDANVSYKNAPLNPKGDIVTGLEEQIAVLSSANATKSQKELALKIIIHLVGDLHQPMHLGHLSDLGGNKVKVKFFNRETNLHSVWDGSLMNSAHSWSYTEWQQQIDRLSLEEEAAEVVGSVDDWAIQTYEIATRVYNYFPSGTKVSYNHIAAWRATIERQLLRGGLRLAHILNGIFDRDSER